VLSEARIRVPGRSGIASRPGRYGGGRVGAPATIAQDPATGEEAAGHCAGRDYGGRARQNAARAVLSQP
jgi:hypothetical protein